MELTLGKVWIELQPKMLLAQNTFQEILSRSVLPKLVEQDPPVKEALAHIPFRGREKLLHFLCGSITALERTPTRPKNRSLLIELPAWAENLSFSFRFILSVAPAEFAPFFILLWRVVPLFS